MKIKSLLSNKKTLLSLVAGVTITLGAIAAGTYAWFTDSATSSIGDYETATVDVTQNNSSVAFGALSFTPGDEETIEAQRELEGEVARLKNAGASQTELDNAFADWWNKYYNEGGQTWDNVSFEDKRAVDGVVSNVTPGDIVYAMFDFTNNSTVPVYFRISKAALSDALNTTGFADISVSAASISYEGKMDGLLTLHGDYYYCSEPIENADKIGLILEAYILGGANGNQLQNHTFTFGGTTVELIQATNNAVYLDNGWAGIANTNFFTPYTSANGSSEPEEPVEP